LSAVPPSAAGGGRGLAQVARDLLAGAAVEIERKEALDLLRFAYAQAAEYDRHYSAVRSGLATFIILAGLTIGAVGFERQDPVGILFPLIMLAFAFAVSVLFQNLTHRCWMIEEAIEDRLVAIAAGSAARVSVPERCLTFRLTLKELIPDLASLRIVWDPPNLLIVAGAIAYGLVALYALVSGG
jgi:hypothetical protein